MNWNPTERRKRRKPQTSWKDGVRVAMQNRNLQENDSAVRRRRRLRCDKQLYKL